MSETQSVCSDCSGESTPLDRRGFLRGVSLAVAGTCAPLFAVPRIIAAPSFQSAAETAAKGLYETLTDEQKKVICFDWNHKDPNRGLLRTFVSNNWQITEPQIRSEFYTKKQQHLIHDVFKGMVNPDWYARFVKHLKEDTGDKEWGSEQSIALFGKPGTDKFEFVMTGRHMTMRADGNTAENVAFGGPIFYGHAANGFVEKPGHPDNVFWEQALAANGVFKLLDDKQQAKALVGKRASEAAVGFQGPEGKFPGIAVASFSDDQKKELQKVLKNLIDPFRKEDQDEALQCLNKQGGLDRCYLSFYQDSNGEGRLDGKNYDNWRLEGPSFVWYFRGTPHVHVWVNIADNPKVPLNARG